MAKQEAQKFVDSISEVDTFEDAAARNSLEVKESKAFARNEYVTGVGRMNEFVGTAFGLKEAEISRPIETVSNVFVLKVVRHEDIDMAAFERQKDSIRKDLLDQAQRTAWTQWYDALVASAEIEDNRDSF